MASSKRVLHIVQGGIDNGDKASLERSGKRGYTVERWMVPSSAATGDELVIYIAGHGLFATATVAEAPTKRKDWPNRYGAAISSLRLINPPISLGVVRRGVPQLAWTRYPRSITTPKSGVSVKLRRLIERRRRHRGAELDPRDLDQASLAELRRWALSKSTAKAPSTPRLVMQRRRERAVKNYALKRAEGACEFCKAQAPFQNEEGSPYLECHHITSLANEGADHPSQVIAVCPNCHRRAHHGSDRDLVRVRMKRCVAILERRAGR
jgi:5-methylcytosine-specific restriction endonuclease McrA